jgi:hypothetical protein
MPRFGMENRTTPMWGQGESLQEIERLFCV